MRLLPLFLLLSSLATAGASPWYLVFIRPDPARQALAPGEGERIQSAHMANIMAMANSGSLVAAGPFGDTPITISGIFVMKADSREAAQTLAAKDPTVTAHRNTVDTHTWNAPAGIGEKYFRMHKENPQTPEGMARRAFVMIRGNAEAAPALLERLRGQGKLGIAGDVTGEVKDEAALRAVAVFKPEFTPDQARAILEEQPEIRSGALRPEYHQWWCAAHVLPWED